MYLPIVNIVNNHMKYEFFMSYVIESQISGEWIIVQIMECIFLLR